MLQVLFVTSVYAEKQTLFFEDFSNNYQEGFLANQNGWIGSRLHTPPVIVKSESGWHVSPLRHGTNHKVEKVIEKLDLSGDEVVYLEMVAQADPSNKYGLHFGVGTAELGKATPHVGLWSRGLNIRGLKKGRSLAMSTEGEPVFTGSDRVVVRSIWDLEQGTAQLFLKNLSEGEEEFKPIYFDAEQTQLTAPLGDTSRVSDWGKVYLGIHGTANCKIESLSVYVKK